MRIAEYKQISTTQEERIVTHPAEYSEDGTLISEEYTETILVDKPVMGLVYRDMTEAEEAELLANQPEEPVEEVSEQDRINAQCLYTAILTDTLLEETDE